VYATEKQFWALADVAVRYWELSRENEHCREKATHPDQGRYSPHSYALSVNVSTASVTTGGSTGYSGLKEANRPGALLTPALG
jgi:hypothetical protein